MALRRKKGKWYADRKFPFRENIWKKFGLDFFEAFCETGSKNFKH
jgi:hypothetical protein